VTSLESTFFVRNWNPSPSSETLLKSGLKLKGDVIEIVPVMSISWYMEGI
jgi:hypothetical protein